MPESVVEIAEEEQKSLGGVLRVRGGGGGEVIEMGLEELERREIEEIMGGKEDRGRIIRYLEEMIRKGGKENHQGQKKKGGAAAPGRG